MARVSEQGAERGRREKKGRPEPPHNPSSGEIDAPEKTRRKMVLVGKVPLPPVLIPALAGLIIS
jgi:hypothetical protein